MSIYIVQRSSAENLDTVVFGAGPSERDEAVAIFTSPAAAEKYIQAAGWERDYTAASLDPIPFLEWLLQAHRDGVGHLVLDPDHAAQQAGAQLNTLDIEAQLVHAGQHIIDVAQPDF